MKTKILLPLLIMFISLFDQNAVAQKGTLDIGAAFMWNNGILANPKLWENQKSIGTFSSMLKVEYEVVNRLRISYGIGNLTKGQSGKVTFTGVDGMYENVPISNKLYYLSNQVTIGYRFGNKFAITPELGVAFDALLKHEAVTGAFENVEESKISYPEYYGDWSNCLVAGVNLRFPLGEKFDLGGLLKVSQGLNDVSNKEYKIVEGKPTNLLVGAEIVWHLKKGKE